MQINEPKVESCCSSITNYTNNSRIHKHQDPNIYFNETNHSFSSHRGGPSSLFRTFHSYITDAIRVLEIGNVIK